MTVSNYDIMRDEAARLFAQTDHATMATRFNLAEEDGFLPLRFFQQPFRVHLESGTVERLVEGAWTVAGYNEAMTIYDLLGYAQPTCHASGSMINTRSLHNQIASAAPSPQSFFKKQEGILQEHQDQIQQVLEAMGGIPLGKADASVQFTVLDDLTMQVHFWCADEDFPPTLQLFWDENVLQYMHYETVWYANGFIVGELMAHLEH